MSLYSRAAKIWATEGFVGLLRGVLRFARTLTRRLYFRADFYIHRFDLELLPGQYAFPVPAGLDVQVVESNEAAARLADAGYEDFRPIVPLSDYRLRSGAVGFCAYIDQRVAHLAWIGMTDGAKRSFDPLPYPVDFSHGEGTSGGSWTFPAYRGRGIYRYVMWQRLWYLRERGCTMCRNATEVGNAPGIRGQDVFPSHIVGILRVKRVCGVERSHMQADFPVS